MRKKYKTIDEAQDTFGLTVDSYLGSECNKENAPAVEPRWQKSQVPLDEIPEKVMSLVAKLSGNQLSKLVLHIIEHLSNPNLQCTLRRVLPKVLPSLCVSDVLELLTSLFEIASLDVLLTVADSLVCRAASKSGLSWNVKGFLNTACRAMCELEAHGKPSVVYFLCRCLADEKEDGKTHLLSMDRMPFGLIQYHLEFFNAKQDFQVHLLSFHLALYFSEAISNRDYYLKLHTG